LRFYSEAEKMGVKYSRLGFPSAKDQKVLEAMKRQGYTVVRDKIPKKFFIWQNAARYVDSQGKAYCLRTLDAIRDDLASQLTSATWGNCKGEKE
jgi:hypothetical protein